MNTISERPASIVANAGTREQAPSISRDLSVAVVHDNFAQMGGAERVAEAIYSLVPGAHLHSTLAVRERLSPGLQAAQIRTSWMQKLPAKHRLYRHYFMLYPAGVRNIDISSYDVVLSSCFGYAKGVKKRKDAVHICYCHTPMRWVWRFDDYSEREGFSRLQKSGLVALLRLLKMWDKSAADRPDYYIANSEVVRQRIRTLYGRDAVVIPPPIDTSRFRPGSERDEHYLVLSRLVAYKRIDLAVKACSRLGRRLVVIGDGPDRKRLEAMAGPSVSFMGRQPDAVVERYASSCRALLFPGEEDFGMAPLEINAAGRPVIAFNGGGAGETVLPHKTGILFNKPHADSLASAIEEFESLEWDSSAIRNHAMLYDQSAFAAKYLAFVRDVIPGWAGTPEPA